jgi:hypothetical protein
LIGEWFTDVSKGAAVSRSTANAVKETEDVGKRLVENVDRHFAPGRILEL